MVKHLFYAAYSTSPCRTSARQGGERSGPCRDVRVTELCEVKGDVTIPELKRQKHGAHSPHRRTGIAGDLMEYFKRGNGSVMATISHGKWPR